MKRIIIVILVMILAAGLAATEIEGQWNALLDVFGAELRLVVHITDGPDGISGTLDSPDQDAYGIEIDEIEYDSGKLVFSVTDIGLRYDGMFDGEMIRGIFNQGGFEAALVFSREELPEPEYDRPQEPQEPFPYRSQDVFFENPQAGIKLAGTLTLPQEEGIYPAVVLVSGSGPQDRNEELLHHKPFLVLSDHLTRAGIAVLRYDDRGVAESDGVFSGSTTFDFASDAQSAVAWLRQQKEIGRVGIIGHSEGGIIAPIVASEDKELDFIVLLAGTGVRGDEVLMKQTELISISMGTEKDKLAQSQKLNRMVYDLVLDVEDKDELTKALDKLVDDVWEEGYAELFPVPEKDTAKMYLIDEVVDDWMLTFMRLDPALYLEKVTIPVLAVNGDKDLQVEVQQNLTAIREALERAGNPDFTTIEYEGLNHLFQHTETGNPNEYIKIEETFAVEVMEDIVEWILERE